MVVGRLLSFWVSAYFHGRTCCYTYQNTNPTHSWSLFHWEVSRWAHCSTGFENQNSWKRCQLRIDFLVWTNNPPKNQRLEGPKTMQFVGINSLDFWGCILFFKQWFQFNAIPNTSKHLLSTKKRLSVHLLEMHTARIRRRYWCGGRLRKGGLRHGSIWCTLQTTRRCWNPWWICCAFEMNFLQVQKKRSAEEELYFRSLLVDPGANVKKENVATETEDTLAVVS